MMPTVNVVDPGSFAGSIAVIAAYNNDFAYSLPRTGERWLALWYDESPSPGFERPGMYRSTDGGATWTRYGDATAPVLSFHISAVSPLAYDSRFNILNPASQSSITIWYADDSSAGPTFNFHLIDFDFTTRSYGSPYGALSLTDIQGQTWGFSSLPAGGFILFYNRAPSGTTNAYYRIYSGGWGSETLLASNKTFCNLAVDASGNSHVMLRGFTYYRVDSSGTVVDGPTSISAGANEQNLVLAGSDIVFLTASGLANQFIIATGSPATAPTWSTQTIGGIDVATGTLAAWYANLSSAYAVDLELSGHHYDYMVDFLMPSVSGPTIHWGSGDASKIYRAVYSGGSWGTPTVIWNTSGPATPNGVSTIIARGIGGGSGNRSFPR